MAVSYETLELDVQSVIFNLIKDNLTTSAKVLDGIPNNLMKGIGFPYVLVRSPVRLSDTPLTNGLREITISVPIHVYVKDKESILRTLLGEIMGILKNNQVTTRENNIFRFMGVGATPHDYEDRNNKIYSVIMNIRYRVVLW